MFTSQPPWRVHAWIRGKMRAQLRKEKNRWVSSEIRSVRVLVESKHMPEHRVKKYDHY